MQCGNLDVIVNMRAPIVKQKDGKLITCKHGGPRGPQVMLSGVDHTIQRPATVEEVMAAQLVEAKAAALNLLPSSGGDSVGLVDGSSGGGAASTTSTSAVDTTTTTALPNDSTISTVVSGSTSSTKESSSSDPSPSAATATVGYTSSSSSSSSGGGTSSSTSSGMLTSSDAAVPLLGKYAISSINTVVVLVMTVAFLVRWLP